MHEHLHLCWQIIKHFGSNLMVSAHNPDNHLVVVDFLRVCKLFFSTWIVLTAAARVLSKEVHSLQSTDMRVRKAACKDRRRLLLRGTGPSTSVDLIELYVENTLGLSLDEYGLHFPPARDSVLIQLRQPLSQGESY